jgi:predicted transcriptional regulator
MTTAAGEPEDLLDLPALLHDLDVVRRHLQISWTELGNAAGVAAPVISDLRNGKRGPSLATYQRLVRWLDPGAKDYIVRPASARPAQAAA